MARLKHLLVPLFTVIFIIFLLHRGDGQFSYYNELSSRIYSRRSVGFNSDNSKTNLPYKTSSIMDFRKLRDEESRNDLLHFDVDMLNLKQNGKFSMTKKRKIRDYHYSHLTTFQKMLYINERRGYDTLYSDLELRPTMREIEEDDPRFRVNEKLLFYNRVPKCGSTTMKTVLKSLAKFHPDKNPYYMIDDVEAGRKNYLENQEIMNQFISNVTQKAKTCHKLKRKFEIPENLRRNHVSIPPIQALLYVRHVHYLDFQLFEKRDPIYINIMRDPVEHWISNYYYLRKGMVKTKDQSEEIQKKWDHHEIIDEEERGISIEDCIKNQLPTCAKIYSDLIPYFCGNYDWCRKRNQKALETAKNHIFKKYAVVGILEDLSASFTMFEKIMPRFFRGIVYQYTNLNDKLMEKTKTFDKKEESDFVKNYLRERLQPEIELYEFIKELLYSRLDMISTY